MSHTSFRNLENYDKYKFPQAENEDMMLSVKDTVKKNSDTYFIVGFQHIGLFERAWTLRGYENFLMDLCLNPDLASEILDQILEYKINEAKLYIKSGVDCVRTGDDWGIQTSLAMSPEIWKKFIKPRQAKLWQVYKEAGMPIIHHSCGNIYSIIPDLIEIGLNVLHPIQPLSMDIKQLAAEFGDELIFFGGIDTQALLPKGSPADVKAAVYENVALLGKGLGYIIAPSQEVMSDIPLENIRALIEACQNNHKP